MFTLDKNYGFHDPDLRPKPLRIAKRGHLRKSNSINTSRALSTSSTQRPLVPTRRSSILSTCTQSEVPQQDSLSKGSQWTVEDASCRLDNRFRRSSVDTATAVDTSSGTSGPSTSSKPGRRTYKYNIHNMVENHAEAGSNKIRSSVAARSTAVRAVTTGALNKANAPSATKDEGLPSVPTPLLLRRRAVTHGAPVSGEVETNRNSHGRGLRRQTSFGQGFVARMMSNLAHRSHNGPATTTYQDTSNHGPNEKAISLRAQSLEVREPLGRISESSGGTEGSNGSNLEDALAAFPTPPTSNGTSPRPSETFPAPPSELQRCRSLRKPESTSITGAELSLTAELDELSSDSDSDMLVAIDIEGPINPAASGQDLWSQHTGLDIVVIIDNSLYVSPAMLMASCETTRALASTLNIMTDRLAVLCTSPINDHRTLGSDFTKIWPLSSIKVRKLKTVLDAIVNTKEKPTACSWANTIKVATETLLRSPMLDPDTEFLQDTFGHIIIMTNNANGLSAGMLSHEKLRFHIICPASVPLSDFETMDCNGWKLRSICGDEPQAVDPRKDVNPTTLLNRLRRLIAYARSGKDTGKLTYLSLDIKAGPNCSIQDVMGESEYLTLHPGELRTVLVRLKIRPSKVGENLLTCSTPLPDLFSESGDTLKSIEEFLRLIPRPRTILTARLMYKHSLLPTDTTCSITGECKVENQLSSPRSTAFPQRLLVEESAGLQSMVHERLAYYIATHGSPRHALGAFSTEFGEESWRSFCPDYSHLILKELKYQARILERLEIDASPKKPILPLTMDMASSPESDRGHFVNQDLRDIENHRPESCVIDNPDKEGSSSYNSQGPLVVNKKQPARRTQQKGEKATEARAGKNDQGKKSRGLNLFAQGRAMSLNHEEQRSNDKRRFVGLRHQSSGSQQTLTHKSSMGTLAVRRIFSAGESMGKGLGAA